MTNEKLAANKIRIHTVMTIEQYNWCVAEAKSRGESTATIIREAITLMREKILTDRYAKRLGRD